MHSGHGWADKQHKEGWSREKTALVVVSVLSLLGIAGGSSFMVKAMRNNRRLAELLDKGKELLDKDKNKIQELSSVVEELRTKNKELLSASKQKERAQQEALQEVEKKNASIAKLDKQRIELLGKIEDEIDAGERMVAKLLNSWAIGKYEEVKYSEHFLEQIKNLTAGKRVLSYIENGNLQEIVWHLRDIGEMEKADKLEELLVAVLREEEVVKVEMAEGGRTGAYVLTFKNGMRGVFKNRSEIWEGAAMYRFDKLLNTNSFPITVKRVVELSDDIELVAPVKLEEAVVRVEGSVQLFVENSIHMSGAGKIYGDNLWFIDQPRRLRTLALLANDGDMGAHNVLLPAKGRALGIDGGHAFLTHRKTSIHASLMERDVLGRDEVQNNLHKYYTHPDFIRRLQEIDDKDLQHVVEPLFNFFREEEMAILKKFDDAITSENSRDKLEAAIENGILQDMADELRVLYKQLWPKHDPEDLMVARVDYYREKLQVADFLRKSIADYVETVQASW